MPLTESQIAPMDAALTDYQASLMLDGAAAAYLAARGISEATAAMFRLGVAANPAPGHSQYEGKIVIPYLDKRDRPLAFRFHEWRQGWTGAKYLSMSGDPARIFNVGAISRAADVIDVCEGEFDAMVLAGMGLHAVALPGAATWCGVFRRMLHGFPTIRLWADGDDAGAELARRVSRSIPRVRVMRLPNGADVTDVWKAGGEAALLNLIGEKE